MGKKCTHRPSLPARHGQPSIVPTRPTHTPFPPEVPHASLPTPPPTPILSLSPTPKFLPSPSSHYSWRRLLPAPAAAVVPPGRPSRPFVRVGVGWSRCVPCLFSSPRTAPGGLPNILPTAAALSPRRLPPSASPSPARCPRAFRALTSSVQRGGVCPSSPDLAVPWKLLGATHGWAHTHAAASGCTRGANPPGAHQPHVLLHSAGEFALARRVAPPSCLHGHTPGEEGGGTCMAALG